MSKSNDKPISRDLHPGPGFRIRKGFARPSKRQFNAFGAYPLAVISDYLNRLYAMSPAIHLVTDLTGFIRGPACTVKLFPGDNLMVHKAIDVAKPGDIIVVDTCGFHNGAALGELTVHKAKFKKIAGFIIDGLVRDISGVLESGVPVFARGTTAIGPLHRGPGEVNYPIQCGGVVVNPGDIVLGDKNGTVVVPKKSAQELLARLAKNSQVEVAYESAVKRGKFSASWVDEILREGGCKFGD